jgi:hypothetical protein
MSLSSSIEDYLRAYVPVIAERRKRAKIAIEYIAI